MFRTLSPGTSVRRGPASNITTRTSGTDSIRIRAYAEPIGPLPTIATVGLLAMGAPPRVDAPHDAGTTVPPAAGNEGFRAAEATRCQA